MKTILKYENDNGVGSLYIEGEAGKILSGIAQTIARMSQQSGISIIEMTKAIEKSAVRMKKDFEKGDNK